MPFIHVTELALWTSGNTLYASIMGRGAFKRTV
jgi:hypothetical protein